MITPNTYLADYNIDAIRLDLLAVWEDNSIGKEEDEWERTRPRGGSCLYSSVPVPLGFAEFTSGFSLLLLVLLWILNTTGVSWRVLELVFGIRVFFFFFYIIRN